MGLHYIAPKSLMRSSLIAPGLCLGALVVSSAFAQPTPDAGALLNQQQRQQQRLPERLPEAERPPVRPALKESPGLKVRVKSIRFTGHADLATDAELNALVVTVIGAELDFVGLEQLARSVTDYLRGKGWFLAEAYLPRQDITDGHIEILIRPGRLDGKEGKGEPYIVVPGGKVALRIDTAQLDAIAAKLLAAGATAQEGDMERAMLLINDLPGVSARARLEAGVEEGSTRVYIDVEEGPLVTGTAGFDNQGNRDTGVAQLNLAAQLNDPLGIGDQTSLSATHTQGLDLARLGVTLPIGSYGTKLNVAWSDMRYQIIRGTGLAAGLKGTSSTGGLTLSHPFLRSRNANLYGTLGVTAKAFRDDSLAGLLKDKRIDAWNAGASADSLDTFGGGGLTSWNAGWTAGKLRLERLPADQVADAAGYNTQGRYSKLNYGAARLQKLPANFTLFANVSGQSANKNLDSSEKFLLGGPNGVRAYPGSEASGDAGWLANLEVRYDLPGGTDLGQLQMIGFYDAGRIVQHQDPKAIAIAIAIATFTGRNVYALSGWGVGLNLSKTGSHSVRLSWAQKIGDNPGRSVTGLDADSRADRSRVWLQGTLFF